MLYPALAKGDLAFPTMVKNLLPTGLSGLVMAGLVGAIMSTVDSLLNSSSTIVTMDIYKKYLNPTASDKTLTLFGRITTAVVLILAICWAPLLQNMGLIFLYIQNLWGYIFPAFATIFLLGIFWKKANSTGAMATLICGIPMSILIETIILPGVVFVNRIAINFVFCVIVMIVVSFITRKEEKKEAENLIWRPTNIKLNSALLYNRALAVQPIEDVKPIRLPWYKDYRI